MIKALELLVEYELHTWRMMVLFPFRVAAGWHPHNLALLHHRMSALRRTVWVVAWHRITGPARLWLALRLDRVSTWLLRGLVENEAPAGCAKE